MIRQQPEGHDTFASGDSCFCAAKVAPVTISIITDSVNWLSDKRYYCVRINPQVGPLSRTEQKSLWPQAVFREPTDITTFIYNIWGDSQLGKLEFWQKILTITVEVVTIRTNKVKCYEQEKSSGCLTESCGLLWHSRGSWEYTLVSCRLKSSYGWL